MHSSHLSLTLARLICFGYFLLGLAYSQSASAQLKPDRTLGNERSVVERNQRVNGHAADLITGGARAETNLFHSFQEFNIDHGQRLYFANPSGIENIFTRITGNHPSRIRGLLGVNGTANLFLLNPNGVIFGNNATLDVRGSFLATTAESIVFNDNIQFRADAAQPISLLRVSVPIGLQFGRNPGTITNRSIHQVPESSVAPPISSGDSTVGLNLPPGQTLALVGGDIFLEGGELTAPAGRIELGSVADPGRVHLIQIQQGWRLSYSDIQNFDDIQLSDRADVDASGVGGGAIHVRGNRILVRDGSVMRTNTLGDQDGGNLVVIASDLVEISDVYRIAGQPDTDNKGIPFASGLFVRARNTGRSGNLVISTARLRILAGAQVSTSITRGNPPSAATTGNITVRASELELAGVTLSADGEPLTFSNGAPFPSALSTFTDSDRRAGDLTITTRRLSLRDGAVLQTSTQGSGRAGNLRIRAELIDIAGRARGLTTPTGLLAFSGGIARTTTGVIPDADATGQGGNLEITTRRLNLRDGAVVAVGSSNPRGMAGASGNLRIQADTIRLDHQAQLTAATEDVNGGNIQLRSQDLLLLRRHSQISASAGDNNTQGNGGNINITTPLVLAAPLENSDITANAFEGAGGQVRVRATTVGIAASQRPTDQSDITAFSERGVSGVVTIDSPEAEVRPEAAELPIAPVRTDLAQGCQIEGTATASFFNTGRGGLALTPYEPLSDSDILTDLRLPDALANRSANSVVEAKGWIRNQQGDIMLVTEIPTANQSRCHLR
jgi:filamentous hemagglutinin family protein